MSCNQIDSNLCVDNIQSTCVEFRGKLGANSKIESECVDQEMVNEDLYELNEDIYTYMSTAGLGDLSIDFGGENPTIKTVIEVYEAEIDALKTKVTNLENLDYCDIDITGCGIDFGLLTDPCDTPITTLGQLLNTLVSLHNS